MSENLNVSTGEPEDAQQPPAREQASQGQIPPISPASEQAFPLSESVMPEIPAQPDQASIPAYPPPPEYYKQLPAMNAPGTPPPGVPLPPPPVYGYGYTPPPPNQPLPLGQAMRDLPRQYKKVLLKPGVRSFVEEQGKAGWGIVWSQLLFMTALQILVSIPFFISYNQSMFVNMSSTGTPASAEMFASPAFLIIEIVFTAVLTPLAFFIQMGVQYLLARAFKGIGTFKQQAYNQLLFQVPLGLISSLLSLVFSVYIGSGTLMLSTSASAPTVTSSTNGLVLLAILLVDLMILGLSVYGVVLNIFSLMAAHRLSSGRATASVLIPIGVMVFLFLLCFCALFLIGVMAFRSVVQP